MTASPTVSKSLTSFLLLARAFMDVHLKRVGDLAGELVGELVGDKVYHSSKYILHLVVQ